MNGNRPCCKDGAYVTEGFSPKPSLIKNAGVVLEYKPLLYLYQSMMVQLENLQHQTPESSSCGAHLS